MREETAGKGVDVVLDMVAGPYMQKNLSVLGRDGRYVIIAFLAGSTAELNMREVLIEAPDDCGLDIAAADHGGESRDRRRTSRKSCAVT